MFYIWLRDMLRNLRVKLENPTNPTTIHQDNNAAITMTMAPILGGISIGSCGETISERKQKIRNVS
jgi:hypothetical protein